MKLPLVLLSVLLIRDGVSAFAPPLCHHRTTAAAASETTTTTRSGSALLMATKSSKKKSKKGGKGGGGGGTPKLSYAERLALHREKVAKEQGLEAAPPMAEASGTAAAAAGTGAQKQDEENPQQLAKKLIDAQRKSVDMLTFVKDRVEGLPIPVILEALDSKGYIVIDDFLANDDVVSQIAAEGLKLFGEQQMETDLTRLGSGDFYAAIKGGEDQYPLCPRTIELVVSTTKHFPPLLKGMNLDGSNIMATMRTYDRSSRLASLSLVENGDLPPQPFGVIADEEEDARKVSMIYYPISSEWKEGGITIEEGGVAVSAKRDRLVLLRSDTCRCRSDYFVGNDDGLANASCLELHFISSSAEKTASELSN